jgi:hypothetical protein
MNKTQKGFAALEALLILIIVGVISGIGWYVLHTKHQTDRILSQADKISQSTPSAIKPSTAKSTTENASAKEITTSNLEGPGNITGYLTIKEWGIKIKLALADPSIIQYKLIGANNDAAGPIHDTAILSLNASVSSNTNCQILGIGINQRMNNSANGKHVGNYWYDVGGSPYSCQDQKIDSIRQQYTGNNPVNWEYSAL